jgi:TusA-related sulfurtransferase
VIELDLWGYECPMPVVKVLKAMEKNPGEDILALVEKKSSCDDIERICKKRGYSVKIEGVNGDFRVMMTPLTSPEEQNNV